MVAAVSIPYPHPCYQGTDVSELGELLGTKIAIRTTPPVEQWAFAVTTRAKEAAEASKEQQERSNKENSGVNPTPVESSSASTDNEVWDLGNEFDDCNF